MDIATLKIAIDSREAMNARRDLAGVEQQAGKTEQATVRMARQSGSALGDMSGFIRQVAGVLAAANLAREFIRTADAVTVLNNQLKLAMGTAQAAGQAYKDLYLIAQASRVSFTDLGATFAGIRRATEDAGLSYGRLLTVTEAIGNAMAVSGGSAQGMNAALIQLQQGFASGTLRGEELNSVMEQTPRLAQAIADGLGITRGQLRAMGQDGKLTSEAVIRALESQAGVLKGEVAGATLTAGQAYTVMANATTKLIGQFDQLTGASAGVASAMASVGSAMDGLGQFMDRNKDTIQIVTGALAGAAVVAGIMKMAGAIVAVKVAFAALTAVMAANPLGLALLGIGAVAGAIAGVNAYNNAFAKTREGMVQTIQRLEETNKSVEKSIYGPPTAGAMKHVEARRKQIAELRIEIEKLDAAANKAGGGSGSVGSGDTALLREQGKAYAGMAGERQKFLDGAITATQKMNAEIERAKVAFGGMVPDSVIAAIKGKYAAAIKKVKQATDELTEARKRDLEVGELRNKLVQENAEKEARFKKEMLQLEQEMLKPFEQSLEAQIKRVESLQDEEKAIEIAQQMNLSLAQAVEMVNIARLKELQLASMGNPEAIATIQKEIEQRQKLIDLIGNKEARDAKSKADKDAETAATKAANDAMQAFDQLMGKLDGAKLNGLFNGATDGAMKFAYALKSVGDIAESTRAALEANAKVNAADPAKKLAKESQILFASNSALIDSYADMAGGLKSYAKEGSKTYRALEAVEKAYRMAQIAMSIKSMIVDVAANKAKATSGAVAAVANQGTGDPYTAFPRIAAMIALMAGLGIFVGGGKGGSFPKSNNGTGTVFGDSDAQSESLKKSMDVLNDTQDAALSYSRAMAASLRTIEGSIGGLTNVYLRSGGAGAITSGISTGQFDTGLSSAMKKMIPIGGVLRNRVIDSLFGGKTSISASGIFGGPQSLGSIMSNGFSGSTFADVVTSRGIRGKKRSTQFGELDSAIEQQIGQVFAGIGDSVMASSKLLGLDMSKTEKALQDYVVSLGRIDLQGLNGEQIAEKLNAVFGAEADKIAASVIPGFEKLQQVGEGYFETLTRVSAQFEAVNVWMARFGDTLGVVGIEGAIAADGLIKAFGGLERYNSIASDYYEKFYSEEERNAMKTKELTKALADMGFAMPDSLQAFRDLVNAQDPLTEEGQKAIAALMELSGVFYDVTQAANDAWKALGEGFMKEVDRIRGIVAKESNTNYEYLQARFAILTAQARAGDQTAAGQLVGVSAAINEAASFQARTALELAVMRSDLANSLEETTAIVTGQPVRVDAPITTSNAAEDTKAMRAQIETLNKRIDELTTNSKAENQAQFSALTKLVTILDNATQGGSLAVRTINGETVKTS